LKTILPVGQQENCQSPCRVQKWRYDAGEPKQGEQDEGDEREDHGNFTLPGFGWQASVYLTFPNAGCSNLPNSTGKFFPRIINEKITARSYFSHS
jgi:hypothetical protein